MNLRLAFFAIALVVLTGCDRYIEQVTVSKNGAAEVVIEADLVCTDQQAIELWAGDPCAQVDSLAAGGSIDGLVFGLPDTADGYTLDVSGESGRREVSAEWLGSVGEVSTLIVVDGSVEQVDDVRTRATFSTVGSAAHELLGEGLPGRWKIGEFRVVAPDVVVEHNGDDISGRTVIWEVTDDLPDTLMLTWSSEEPGIRLWWWLVGAVILSGVLMMMVVLEGQRSQKPPET